MKNFGKFFIALVFIALCSNLWFSGCAGTSGGTRSLEQRTLGLYKQGLELYEKEKYIQAVYLLKQTIEFEEDFSEAHYVLGLTYLATKDFNGAIAQLKLADKFEPVTEKPGFDKADILFNIALAELEMQKDQSAKKNFTEAIKLRDDFAAAYYNLAFIAEKEDSLDNAYKYLTKATTLDSTLDSAYVALGKLYRSQEKFDDAKLNFEKAIEIDKENKAAYFELGNIYYLTGEYESAVRYFRRAIQIDEKYLDAYLLLGEAYEKKQAYSDALESFQKAKALNSKPASEYTYVHKKGYASSDSTLKTMFKEEKRVAHSKENVNFKLGTLYEKLNDNQKAIEAYREEIANNPQFTASYINLAILLHKEEQFDEAIAMYQKFVELTPEDDEEGQKVRKILAQLRELN